ncbi:MAG: MotA/TolQ/ExbB proton channel family protein [Pirellulales bacterium]
MSGTLTFRNWGWIALAAVACAALVIASQLPAQDAVAIPPAPAPTLEGPGPASKPILYKNLFEILKSGGIMMIPLFACSFFTLVFVFERAISLRRGRVIPRPFVKRFLHQVSEGKLDREGALALCEESASPTVEVFSAVVKKWGRPSVELEQTIIDAEDRIAPGLRRYIRVFSAVATISPLLGLLGTVFGMIRLFDAISAADAMGRTEILASGISEALLTTAAGLLIAVPALCVHLYFVGRVERLVMAIDELAQDLAGLISAEALHDDRRSRTKGRPTAAA